MDCIFENRLGWIDALKGLGMCLVILGHMTLPRWVSQLIFSFHMPLFFFISGYLYKGNISSRWALRKVDSLLVTYIAYSAITVFVLYGLGKSNLQSEISNLLYGNGVGVTWFLSCLFLAELTGAFIVKLMPKDKTSLLNCDGVSIVLIVATAGWIVPKLGLPSFAKSNTLLAALAFWLAGYVWRGHVVQLYELYIAAFFAALFFVQRVDINKASFGNGVLFYGTAMGFIVLLFHFFEKYQIAFSPLMFIGRRSLEIMCLHGVVPMAVTAFLLKNDVVIPKIIMRMMALAIIFGSAWLIHRYSKLLSGRAILFQRLAR